MPRTRAEVESDPEFQKLSPQARERVLARLSTGQAPAPVAQAEASPRSGGALDKVGSAVGSFLKFEGEVGKGLGKGAARTAIGAAQLVNKIPFPFQGEAGDRRQREDAAFLEQAAKEYAEPEGVGQNLGFAGEQIAEFFATLATTKTPGPAGARIAASAGRIKQGLQPLVRATVGGAKGAAEAGGVRAVQTGGDPAQTATAAALGGAVPAAVEGVARPLARVIAPHVISKVIGATPKSFPAQGKKVLEGARGVAMDLLRHGPVNSREEFLELAVRRMDFVTKQIERARGRGMVPGQGIVPRRLLDAEEHTKLLVDGLTGAIQKAKAKSLPDVTKFALRAFPLAVLGAINPTAGIVTTGSYLAEKALERPSIASRLARFGFELGKSRPSNAHLRLPGVPPVMARGSGRAAGETANVVGQRQIGEAEVTALEAFSKVKNLTPEGQAAHRAMRTQQVRDVLQSEGLSEAETTAAEGLYFQHGDLTLQEAIDAVLRRR